MDTKLTFKVKSHGKPYGVMVLRDGFVTARIGRLVLRHALLPVALQWLKARNPDPGFEPIVTIVGRFRA